MMSSGPDTGSIRSPNRTKTRSTRVDGRGHGSITRNEGVPGSSPGVGFPRLAGLSRPHAPSVRTHGARCCPSCRSGVVGVERQGHRASRCQATAADLRSFSQAGVVAGRLPQAFRPSITDEPGRRGDLRCSVFRTAPCSGLIHSDSRWRRTRQDGLDAEAAGAYSTPLRTDASVASEKSACSGC
jgi:hypothetical protein